jgi:hypothetical protein
MFTINLGRIHPAGRNFSLDRENKHYGCFRHPMFVIIIGTKGGDRMKKNGMRRLSLILSFGLILLLCAPALSQEVPRITKEELKERLGKPDVVVVDVRASRDWKGSTMKIKGAIREEDEKIDSWMSKYNKDQTLVFYCA